LARSTEPAIIVRRPPSAKRASENSSPMKNSSNSRPSSPNRSVTSLGEKTGTMPPGPSNRPTRMKPTTVDTPSFFDPQAER